MSNWASDSVSVIDTASFTVVATVPVGDNPNDMALSRDNRLFVACSNDNSVVVVDTATQARLETIVTSMFPRAPVGSTPNALALSGDGHTLYVANADNNNVAVVDVVARGASVVLGFLPAGWYPSAVAVDDTDGTLYVGNSKGARSYPTKGGVTGPEPPRWQLSVKSSTKGMIQVIDVAKERRTAAGVDAPGVRQQLPTTTRCSSVPPPGNADRWCQRRSAKARPSST